MPENRLDIPCNGGTIIVETSGDGVIVKFITPDARVWDEKKIVLEGRKLQVN